MAEVLRGVVCLPFDEPSRGGRLRPSVPYCGSLRVLGNDQVVTPGNHPKHKFLLFLSFTGAGTICQTHAPSLPAESRGWRAW